MNRDDYHARTWRDYMPEWERAFAEQHPGYAEAFEGALRVLAGATGTELRGQLEDLAQ